MVDQLINRFIKRENKRIQSIMASLPLDSFDELEDISRKIDEPLVKLSFPDRYL